MTLPRNGGRWRAATIAFLILLPACGEATTRMQPGVPIEVKRGYCFVSTEYRQRGHEVNRTNTLERLGHYQDSAPYVSSGNAFAIGSIAATVVSTGTLTAGLIGTTDGVDMDETLSTALIATGIGTGILSWVLCITSDGKYATAAEVYNDRLAKGHLGADEDLPSDVENAGGDAAPAPSHDAAPASEPP